MPTRTSCLLPLLAGALLGGCQPQYTQPVLPPEPQTAAQKDFEAVWAASCQTLRDYRFELDRQDRRDGVITTMPMAGMHFFELWRKDATGPLDYGESSLQTIYRRAKVTISPVGPGAEKYKAQVEVLLSRSDKPKPLITSTSQAHGLFASSRRRAERQVAQESAWDWIGPTEFTDLGNDRGLEARLTSDIAAAADKLRAQAGQARGR